MGDFNPPPTDVWHPPPLEAGDIDACYVKIYGVSNGKAMHAENHGEITMDNVATKQYIYIVGCARGKYNVNYADINISRCVGYDQKNPGITVYGVADCRYEYNAEDTEFVNEYLENRGNITVSDLNQATVNGESYIAPLEGSSDNIKPLSVSIYGVSAGSGIYERCVNFGTLSAQEISSIVYIGGVSSSPKTNACLNYGEIHVSHCSLVGVYVGGISTSGDLLNCLNFGDIYITDLHSKTSYPSTNYNMSRTVSVGGVSSSGSRLKSCANYGNIYYKNDQGYNADNAMTNTRKDCYFTFGGVCGSGGYDSYNLLNYGHIVIEEEPNSAVAAGGIFGTRESGTCENIINYGNILCRKIFPIIRTHIPAILTPELMQAV